MDFGKALEIGVIAIVFTFFFVDVFDNTGTLVGSPARVGGSGFTNLSATISALTRATLIEIVQCPETRALASEIMTEVDRVARKLGIEMGVTIEQRLEGAEKVGHHKTSMLQDIEAGKPTELEAIAGAVLELGEKLAGLAAPQGRHAVEPGHEGGAVNEQEEERNQHHGRLKDERGRRRYHGTEGRGSPVSLIAELLFDQVL
jgi:uncharacterized protein YoxC